MPIIKAPCKINISLDITSKRKDGYHLIESLFHTVNLYDIIAIEKADKYNIITSGKYALEDDKEENIVTRIFNHFKNNMNLNNDYNIHIEKNIPTGAGLGGGSSDAANIIKFFRLCICRFQCGNACCGFTKTGRTKLSVGWHLSDGVE